MLIGRIAQGDSLGKPEHRPTFHAHTTIVVGPHTARRGLLVGLSTRCLPLKREDQGVVVLLILPLILFESPPPAFFSPAFQLPLPLPFSIPIVPDEDEGEREERREKPLRHLFPNHDVVLEAIG
jgi:hypothetical protein